MDSFLTPEQEAASLNTSPERLWELVAYQNDDLALLVAQNYHAPAELLEELALIYGVKYSKGRYYLVKNNHTYNPAILRVITAHPNTSLDMLLGLGEDFPQEMLDNPVFNLSLLEDPTLLDKIPIKTIKSLLKLEIVPSFLMRAILSNTEHNQFLIAEDSNTPSFILEGLSQHINSKVRYEVARNPNTPISVLRILAQDASFGVRYEVAVNPNTPISVLQILTQDASDGVRCGVANNPNTPSNILQILAQDAGDGVRCRVAVHPNTPISVLQILTQDVDEWVRCGVAENPNTSSFILEALTQDADSRVRIRVARNPNRPRNLLEILAQDTDSDIRKTSEEQLHCKSNLIS